MSFGTSVGDIIVLTQLAHKNYRNCKQAGGEYLEIASEVRSLHSVLRTVRDEAKRRDSLIFNSGPEITKELTNIADGCKGVLEGIDALLTKYRGLAPGNIEFGKAAKLWQRWKFGTEIEDLGKLRWKIITYTSSLAVLVDSIHMKATERVGDTAGRIESQVGTGFAEVQNRLEGFEDMRKAILFIATRARASERFQAMESVLSLSTYAGDDKEVWRQFRSQLVSLGFRSDSLDRHMEVLKAYMMKLDQTGVLDEAVKQNASEAQSWCGNASFRTTNLSLLGTGELEELVDGDDIALLDSQPAAMTSGLPPARIESVMDATHTASISPVIPEPSTRKSRRIPRIKVDQPVVAAPEPSDEQTQDPTTPQVSQTRSPVHTTPTEAGGAQISSSGEGLGAEIDSGVDFANPRKLHPYAESYHSVSEAATSQSTLIREASDLMQPASVQKESRPPNSDRPSSWAGPERGKNKVSAMYRYQKQTSKSAGDSDMDSDDTIGRPRKVSTARREADRRPDGGKKKVDDWLKLPNQQTAQGRRRRTREKDPATHTKQEPISRSSEELRNSHSLGVGLGSPPSPRRDMDFVLPNRPGLQSAERDFVTKRVEDWGAYDPQPQDSYIKHRTRRPRNEGGPSKTNLVSLAAAGLGALTAKRFLRNMAENDRGSRRRGDSSDDESEEEADAGSPRWRSNANASGPRKGRRPASRSPNGTRSSRRRSSHPERPEEDSSGNSGSGLDGGASRSRRRRNSSEQSAKAALLTGATEAFRVRNEPGSWSGSKGTRILTAAFGAGGLSTAAESDLP
ncbi:uncharacterized protein L3040_008271 [Drepanopeziza brunnea f. sp. 'multigermtubi']|uniref:uncharacterized protein n=1 Tax=Drepanopeziza brunnea f. sp. 'multigermtubi' TaxID=698441 RepID=UPI00239F202F|nr:hypothetical protein L3040_008271 [Drepanopeziza brunnea f. sp. 'multigermtubi']